MEIKFGVSGLGGKDVAITNLEKYAKLGLKACEVAFTYSVYLKKDDAIEIGKKARELGISLSIHAQYFVNLNSLDAQKRGASRSRILKCCEIGHYLSDDGEPVRVVFHPGFYSGDRDSAFDNIKKGILTMQDEIKSRKWNVILCAETMGKVNVFGSIEEISRLVKETGCEACIDFAHVMARANGDKRFKEIAKAFSEKKWQCHFSGIVYGDKGEKKHKPTLKEEWKELLDFLHELKGKSEIVIINESPSPVKDAVQGLGIWEKKT